MFYNKFRGGFEGSEEFEGVFIGFVFGAVCETVGHKN